MLPLLCSVALTFLMTKIVCIVYKFSVEGQGEGIVGFSRGTWYCLNIWHMSNSEGVLLFNCPRGEVSSILNHYVTSDEWPNWKNR